MTESLFELVRSATAFLPALLAGAGVGFLSGMFGVGGGFLIVPVLHLVLRVDMDVAVGSGACQVLGPATTSLLARRIELKNIRLPLTITGGLLIGVFSGAHVLELAKRQENVQLAGRSINAVELMVLAAYFILLLGIGCFAFWESGGKASDRPPRRGSIASWPLPPFCFLDEFDQSRASILVLSWFGLAVGFVSGLLGMSGGLVLIPGLIYLLGMKTQDAIAGSLVIVWLVSFQGTIAHAWHGNVNLPLVSALLIGGTVGARIGSDVGIKQRGRNLRRRFSVMLLGTALLIGVSLVRLLIA